MTIPAVSFKACLHICPGDALSPKSGLRAVSGPAAKSPRSRRENQRPMRGSEHAPSFLVHFIAPDGALFFCRREKSRQVPMRTPAQSELQCPPRGPAVRPCPRACCKKARCIPVPAPAAKNPLCARARALACLIKSAVRTRTRALARALAPRPRLCPASAAKNPLCARVPVSLPCSSAPAPLRSCRAASAAHTAQKQRAPCTAPVPAASSSLRTPRTAVLRSARLCP